MPTAVLDLDPERLTEGLKLSPRYDSALVLLRVGGRPAGQAVLSLDGRALDPCELRHLLLKGANSTYWEAWLSERLGLPEQADSWTPSGATATVVICTRDRTEDLRRCLTALLAMPDDGHDILVVDNAPATNDTRLLLQSFPSVHYVREDRPGLDVARNRALLEANTEIIAFTDDDAIVDPLWLRMILRNFRDPLVMAVTGLTMASELETSAQVSFQRYSGFVRGFRRVTYDTLDINPMFAWHVGAGVSMALRREVLECVGSFDEALDAGTPTQAGGDTDMFRRILKAGYRITYDPAALNWHRHRRTETELQRQIRGYEISGGAVLCRALLFEGDLGAAAHGLLRMFRELHGAARAFRGRPSFATLKPYLLRIGAFISGLGLYVYARVRAK